MSYIFITGFTAAFIGSAIPGILNMTAAKISINYNNKKASLFSIGASMIVGIYAIIAFILAQYISISQALLQNLYKAGSIIFIGIAAFFLFKGRKEKKHNIATTDPQRNNFLISGALLSVLNILPLPYYIIITVLLHHDNNMPYNIQNNAIL